MIATKDNKFCKIYYSEKSAECMLGHIDSPLDLWILSQGRATEAQVDRYQNLLIDYQARREWFHLTPRIRWHAKLLRMHGIDRVIQHQYKNF